MFTFYELAGVVTNLVAGLVGAKCGIKFTLVFGLALQVFSFGLLFAWNDEWEKTTAIVYVTVTQVLGGIAKDINKLGGKTVTKLVTPEEQETRLFKLVSLLTGWKNSLKGVGYFLGSALVSISFELALGCMIVLLLIAMPWAIFGLDTSLGRAKKENATLDKIFDTTNWNLNVLSLARCFLFASRDFWFEVPLPFYLRSPACVSLLNDCANTMQCVAGAVCGETQGMCINPNPGGGCGGPGMSYVLVGAFLGGYIILYGQVQSWTPQMITGPLKQTPPNKLTEVLWGIINTIPSLVMSVVMLFAPSFTSGTNRDGQLVWLISAIISFAIIFAINSSIHSYLVVKYAPKEKVATSVGFYYMSNACGRLLGTLGSGFLYAYVGEDYGEYVGRNATTGLAVCFIAGTACSALAAFITVWLRDEEAGLMCGNIPIVNAVVNIDINEEKIQEGKNSLTQPLL